MLRTQIKGGFSPLMLVERLTGLRSANAVLWSSEARAPFAPSRISEVDLIADGGGQEKTKRGYTAILTVSTGFDRGWSIAAKGEGRESVVAALRSLLNVTAVALEKFRGNVFKIPNSPGEIAGGLINECLAEKTKDKSWTPVFW